MLITRRTALAAAAAQPVRPQEAGIDAAIVRRHDAAVDRYLKIQVTDPKSRWLGGIPDDNELHNPGAAAGAVDLFTAAYFCPSRGSIATGRSRSACAWRLSMWSGRKRRTAISTC